MHRAFVSFAVATLLVLDAPIIARGDDAPAPPTRVELQLRANAPDIAFQRRIGQSEIDGTVSFSGGRNGSGEIQAIAYNYEPLCTAPCATTLSPGTYRLGLTQGDGHVIESNAPLTITGPGTLSGAYTSRKWTRFALSVSAVVVFLGGAALGYEAFTNDQECDPPQLPGGQPFCHHTTDTGLLIAAISTGVVASVLGVTAQFMRDTVEIAFVPGVGGGVAGREGRGEPMGLSVRGRF